MMKFRSLLSHSLLALFVLLALFLSPVQPAPLPLARLLDYAHSRYTTLISLFDPAHPRYITTGNPLSPSWSNTTALSGWTNGFYPGVLWQLYRHSPSPSLLSAALSASTPLIPWSRVTSTHDVGFILMQSIGLAYNATHNSTLRSVLQSGAHSLSTRFNPRVNCTRSWDSSPAPSFLVIIDNMMNLPLLVTGGRLADNATLVSQAIRHAERTAVEHVRPDGSTYHVVEYNETDGAVIRRYTAQGYADNSTWARGQAWCTYGFTRMFTLTRHLPFLYTAQRCASYFLHRLMSAGPPYIPHWDFDAPVGRGYQPRDTSAAAIVASALVELGEEVGGEEGERWVGEAETLIGNLTTGEWYTGVRKVPLPALLLNATQGPYKGTGSSAPYDVAEAYGEYYFVEALVRLARRQAGVKVVQEGDEVLRHASSVVSE